MTYSGSAIRHWFLLPQVKQSCVGEPKAVQIVFLNN